MQDLSQYQIKTYYELYKEIDITFNKKVMDFMQVLPKEVFLKCKDYIYPCIINSTSMTGARLIAKVNTIFFNRVEKNNKIVHLRFAFKKGDSDSHLSFYVLSKVEEYTPFDSNKPDLYFINLKYTQRPPNDLVIILGTLIEAGSNIKKRKNERIIITPETLKLLKIKKAQAILIINGIQQKCILRDISLSGAKVIASGKRDMYLEKDVFLGIHVSENQILVKIPGRVKRCEEIKGQNEFIVLAINHVDGKVPAEYSRRIIDFMAKHNASTIVNQKLQS